MSDVAQLKRPPGHWAAVRSLVWPPGSTHIAALMWQHKLTPLTVARSISTTTAGEEWIHLSVSRPDRLPSWAELSKARDEFLGEDTEAYQVLARKADHVNLHSFCLHLWAPLDERSRVANLRELTNEVGA